ncbi:FAD-binding oxidoreductase [Aminobacter carboxidus]|nr:FAD-binding oxidoreductase [Aminobacter carboxidus]
MARPSSTAEVAHVLRICAEERIGVVPLGGATGFVGGTRAPQGTLLLSMARMNTIRAIEPANGCIEVEAGCLLANAQAAAMDASMSLSLSFGAEGSAQIGGALATNAGGFRALRFGSARDICLGIEAVTSDGAIWNGLRKVRKDNTGYDLKHLLIGSEGTLAVICAAVLRLDPKPVQRICAVVALQSEGVTIGLLRQLQGAGAVVSAFELFGEGGLALALEDGSAMAPVNVDAAAHALIEIDADAGSRSLLEATLAKALESGIISDAVVAQSEAQRARFWQLREATTDGIGRAGWIASADVSVPLGELAAYLSDIREGLKQEAGAARFIAYGHAGDGNLHLNLLPAKGETPEQAPVGLDARFYRLCYSQAMRRSGSFSAEHGIGRTKMSALAHYLDPVELALMKSVKHALDPLGIMNPGVIID